MGRDSYLRGYNLAMTARTASLSACLLASLTAIIPINFDAEPTMPTLGIESVVDGAYPASGCSVSLSVAGRTAVDPTLALLRTPAQPVTSSDSPFSFVDNAGTAGTTSGFFAAAMIVTTKVEPDGWYMFGSGLGLILLSLGSRRFLRKHQEK
jgi:hypothetical protein